MNPILQNWLGEQIQTLKDQHLYKVPKILESPAAGRVKMNGKEVVNLSGVDADGNVVVRRQLKRRHVLTVFS